MWTPVAWTLMCKGTICDLWVFVHVFVCVRRLFPRKISLFLCFSGVFSLEKDLFCLLISAQQARLRVEGSSQPITVTSGLERCLFLSYWTLIYEILCYRADPFTPSWMSKLKMLLSKKKTTKKTTKTGLQDWVDLYLVLQSLALIAKMHLTPTADAEKTPRHWTPNIRVQRDTRAVF